MSGKTNLKMSLIMAVFLMAMACTAAGDVIYVDDDASLGGNGQTWATAYKYLQNALGAAVSGDEIRVAQGIYKPDRGGGNVPGNRYATFLLKNGVAIKGGYAGFGQPDPDARDIEVYGTVLSGDLLGDDGQGFANNYENSYHVVTGSGTYKTAVMDGFTITAGNAGENQNVPKGWGGGMYNNYGSPTVTNCTFSRNWAGWDGGGMHNRNSSTPTVTNCTFVGNSAEYAGGMYNSWNSNSTITNCTFSGNYARTSGGGMCNWHGSPTLINCTFSGNSAFSLGGGLFNNSEISTLLTNCSFINNSSGQYGGGIYNGTIEQDYSELTLMNCTFKKNWAAVNGGAIDSSGNTDSTIVNCIFTGNVAGQLGGGINSWINSRQTLINCTFSGNSAGSSGGGVYINQSSPTLTNCILWGDTPQEIYVYDGTGTPVITYSDVQGGWPGIGNINSDPLFVDPAVGDYHLLPGSQCIDAGKNSAVPPSVVTDLDGNNRIANGRVDMGVYEFGSTPPPSTLFVDARATGARNGTSWVDAFTDLQEALTFATAFPQVEEILVAQGAYSPEGPLPDIRQASNPNPGDGSFGIGTNADLSWTAGLGAASHDVYFGTTNPPPFVCNQTSTTFDPGTMAFSTNYYWRIDEVNESVVTTGKIWSFATMMSPPPLGSGNEDESIEPAADRSATFQLKNGVVIKGGYAGFGRPDPNERDIKLYKTILSGDIGILGNNSDNSYTVVTGSGTDETAVLDGFTITAGNADGNYPDSFGGGGMYNISGSPTLDNCTFSDNTAAYGAAMYNDEDSSPKLTNCTFRQNSAYSGGAMYNDKDSSPTLTNCTFRRNSADDSGGGMVNSSSSLSLTNCTFSANSAGYVGGGMCYMDGNITLTNCAFFGNLAGSSGGGMFNIMWNTKSSLTLINCTFSGNSAFGKGGGVYTNRGILMLTNCILWGNSPQEVSGAGSPSVTYSDIQGGYPGEGNIDSDPCFVDAGYWDANGLWIDGDYHLLQTSACVNAGDNNSLPADIQDLDGDWNTTEPIPFDLDGNPRIVYDFVDMGAYEFLNKPPNAEAGPDQIIECACNTEEGTKVTLDGTKSSDPDRGVLTYTWAGPFLESPVLGTTSTITLEEGCPGDYVITLVVNDGIDDSEPDDVVITVVDTTPPDFELSVNPTMLWPPDHKMYEITPNWTVGDDCVPSPDVSLVGIVANEGDNTIGDGHTTDDIQINEDGSIYLRSERSGTGNDRVYTITYQAVDDSGNTTVRSATVSIPHDFKVLARIASRWLWSGPAGRIPEDLNGDGFVNLADVARFAGNWTK